MRYVLNMSAQQRSDLWCHLLPTPTESEEAAFLFVRYQQIGELGILETIDIVRVAPDQLCSRSLGHLELKEEPRRAIMKQAHQRRACLVELHSHPYPYAAVFSTTDWLGFDQFVPYVQWRLPGRPYAAVVVAPGSWDGVLWQPGETSPVQLNAIRADGELLRPTGLSIATGGGP